MMSANRKSRLNEGVYQQILGSLEQQSAPVLNIHISNTGEHPSSPCSIYESLANLRTAYLEHYKFSAATIVFESADKNTNNACIVDALQALEEKPHLLPEIFLSGHGRGAINCISMANQIYLAFGSKIQIHLLLTDPVPAHKRTWDTHILPPTVVSFTCFYAAHNITRLILANKSTTISCYPISGSHDSFFDNLGNDLRSHISDIVLAINHLQAVHKGSSLLEGQNAREGSEFRQLTTINNACRPILIFVLNNLRSYQDVDFADDGLIEFENIYQSLDTPKKREKLLQGTFQQVINKKPQSKTTEAYDRVKALQNQLFDSAEARPVPDLHKTHKISFIEEGETKTGYISSLQQKTLDLIRKANDEAKLNKYAGIWETTLATVIALHRASLLKELTQFYAEAFPSAKRSIFSASDVNESDEEDVFYRPLPIKSFLKKFMKNLTQGGALSLSVKDQALIDEHHLVQAIFAKYQDVLSLDQKPPQKQLIPLDEQYPLGGKSNRRYS